MRTAQRSLKDAMRIDGAVVVAGQSVRARSPRRVLIACERLVRWRGYPLVIHSTARRSLTRCGIGELSGLTVSEDLAMFALS